MTSHLTKPIRAIHFMVLASLMTLSTQVNAQARKEFVCNKWSQMTDVMNVKTPLIKHYSKPFVLVADGNTLIFKNWAKAKIVASRLGKHGDGVDLYSQVDEYGTTNVFYYFYKQWNLDVDPNELIEDPDMVELRSVGHSPGDLLGTECFKR
jgi:hypothetical protein